MKKLSKDDTTCVDGEKCLVVLEFHTPNTHSHSKSYGLLLLLASFQDKEEPKQLNYLRIT